LNAEFTLNGRVIGACLNIIKLFQNSVIPARYSIFIIVLLLSPNFTTAQPFQKIYSDLDNATSISVTQNSIYIVEQGKNRLLKLDHNGKLLDTIGGRGSGDYQFSKPVDVDATNGLKIFVSDQNNRRIQVFDRRGQFLSNITERSTFSATRRYHPDQISVSDLGEVYFWDKESRLIRRFDMDYNFDVEFRINSGIRSVDDMQVTSTEILLLDTSTQTIHRLFPNGGYSGFYPAEGIKAFYVDDQGLWKVFSGKAMLEQENGEILEIEFEQEVEPIDMHVQFGSIYILTKRDLYKIDSRSR
jgi:hypothetical protein